MLIPQSWACIAQDFFICRMLLERWRYMEVETGITHGNRGGLMLVQYWLTVLSCLLVSVVSAQETPVPRRLLFIGNSLTASNELPSLVQQLFVTLKQPKPYVESIVMGGASLGDHWRSSSNIKDRIISGKWDYIILQQGSSSLASSQKEFLQDMATAKPWLKESKAVPCLYMVWPDVSRHRYFPQVRTAYANAAKAVDGMFLPAGLALQHVREQAPNLQLFTDTLHPNQLGTYLAGYVIAARLTGNKAEQLPARYSWQEGYRVNLPSKEHQLCMNAVRAALADDGK